MHTVIDVDQAIPEVVWFTGTSTADHVLLEKLTLDKDLTYVFDRRYNDYKAFKLFSDHQTGFVTRLKDNAVYKIEEELLYIKECIHSGVLSDHIIEKIVKEGNTKSKLINRSIIW